MAFAKFQENRFRIDGEIAENHAILVNLTASIVYRSYAQYREPGFSPFKKYLLTEIIFFYFYTTH